MFNLPLRTWICNAAAAFCGRYGAVTHQAQAAGCSRQTVYEQARKVEQRLPQLEQELLQLRAENAQLRQQLDQAQHRHTAVALDATTLPRFAVTAQAMGISLRQIEELLGTLLPPERVPDHSIVGRWTQAAARQASQVLAVLDPHCVPWVETLAIDEIFFGG